MHKALIAILALPFLIARQPPPGVTRTALVDNATVLVARLTMAPGARETPHTHPFSAVVLQLTPGNVEMLLGDKKDTTRREAMRLDFIPREVTHAAANVGQAPFDVITIGIKPDRAPAGAAPVTAERPGITRTIALENNEVRATRVTFAPAAREPEHTHPYDLVIVALSAGRADVLMGPDHTTADHAVGTVWFVPRDLTHAFANAGKGPMDVMSVAIK